MRLLVFILTLFIISPSFAQITISGKVTDNKNKPLQGVSVAIVDSYDGATTDSAGNFSFLSSEKGAQILRATASTYNQVDQNIIVESENLIVNFNMRESITELKAVIISVGSFEASDQKKSTALNPLDIVTTASANGDITSAIKTLPGTQQVGESEGLFVRGGTAGETKYFIDGSLVNKFYYASEPGMATRGRFNPFLFNGTIFSSGGYSALYGQAMSSVLIMESIDLPEKNSADFGLSYLSANAGWQHLAKNKKSSWGFTYSYANLELVYGLIKQKFDYFKVPVIHQGDYNFRIKTSKTGMLKYYGMISHTNVGFRNQDIDSLQLKDAFALKNFNFYHNLSWREKLGSGWKINLSTSYTNNRDNIKMELQDVMNVKVNSSDPQYANKNFGLINKGNYANGKIVMEKKFGILNVVRFGAENNYSFEKTQFTFYDSNTLYQNLEENIAAGFAETDMYVTNNLAAKIGLRTEHSQLLKDWNVAPRLSIAYKFQNSGQASLAYGSFYQNPDNKYLPAIQALHFQKADHYLVQYQKLTKNYTFRTEIFYKKYTDLIKTVGAKEGARAMNNEGFGDAKGIEIFWRDKKTIKNFDYWLSYSFLDTKRNFLNYPTTLEPDFAAKHTASLVMKKFVLPIKTQFNASYTFATGRPFYNIIDQNGNVSIAEEGRTKNYNDLSLSVNYVPSVGKLKAKSFSVIVLSCSNVLGFNNIYSYQFSANGQHKSAITPPSKRFFYVGYFMSLGIDRTEDAINNHL